MRIACWEAFPEDLLAWRRKLGPRPLRSSALENNGVYLVAHDGPTLIGRNVCLESDPIVYVGKASLQTFYGRLTNTHDALHKIASDQTRTHAFSTIAVNRELKDLALGGLELKVAVDSLNIEFLEHMLRKALLAFNAYYKQHRVGS